MSVLASWQKLSAETLSSLAYTVLLAILIAVRRRLVDGPTKEWEMWESLAATQLGIDQSMLETHCRTKNKALMSPRLKLAG